MGKVEAICISVRKGARKKSVGSALFIANHGIRGDAHAGRWHRQISILAAGDIDAVRRKAIPGLKPGAFAENLVLSGIDFSKLGLGSSIRLGKSIEVRVTQIGKQCHSPCIIARKTGDCIMPRRGLFARVVRGGTVSVGDTAKVARMVSRKKFQVVVLTISDRCSRGETVDTAGPATASLVCAKLQAHSYCHEIIPDEKELIAERLRHYCDGHSIDMVITVGGTGFAPRDVTPEAVSEVIHRPVPGLSEAMRAASLKKTSHAMLSRAVCGIRNSTLIISLPGSKRGAIENLSAILPALEHGLSKLRGDDSDCGRGTGKKHRS